MGNECSKTISNNGEVVNEINMNQTITVENEKMQTYFQIVIIMVLDQIRKVYKMWHKKVKSKYIEKTGVVKKNLFKRIF